ncbi:hypothetical protein D081_2049 [Anaerovibrio sp. JC8]|uniref:hypothetical protein n=1 Tax=Anaerovibrio sp. JC8 TaxID=1240085 RepID=UPI000A0D919D|nr:hypothetical protein [Anaerovibrio sp. JC8]ORT99320.1 hypothetical protein D081_2049 [Anaerovibrio sp. JC8]
MDPRYIAMFLLVASLVVFFLIFKAYRDEGKTPRFYRKAAIMFGILTVLNILEAMVRGGADIMLIVCTVLTSVAAAVNWRIYKKGE